MWDAAIVHIADNIAKLADKSGNKLADQALIDPNAWAITGLSEKIVSSVMQISEEHYKQAASLYLTTLAVAPAA